ncbi:MAG: hypothetical protein ABII18_01785 [bacterium]|nr:hypothetical protein [bacterium]MBU1918531.1 hypothetical protein [bacterium]
MNLVVHNLLSSSMFSGPPVSLGTALASPALPCQQTSSSYDNGPIPTKRVSSLGSQQRSSLFSPRLSKQASLGTLAFSAVLLSGCDAIPHEARDFVGDFYEVTGGVCTVSALSILAIVGPLIIVANEHKTKHFVRRQMTNHYTQKYKAGIQDDRVKLICHALSNDVGSEQNRSVVTRNASEWIFTSALFDAIFSEDNLKSEYGYRVFEALFTGMGSQLKEAQLEKVLMLGISSSDKKVKTRCLQLIYDAYQQNSQRQIVMSFFSDYKYAWHLRCLMQHGYGSQFCRLYDFSTCVARAYKNIPTKYEQETDDLLKSRSFIGLSGWVSEGHGLTREQLDKLMTSVEKLKECDPHSEYHILMVKDRMIALAFQMHHHSETYNASLFHRFLILCKGHGVLGIYNHSEVQNIISWSQAIKALVAKNPNVCSARSIDLLLDLLSEDGLLYGEVLEVLSALTGYFSKDQVDRLYEISRELESLSNKTRCFALDICARLYASFAIGEPQTAGLPTIASSLTSKELLFVLQKIPELARGEIYKLVPWLISVIRISDVTVTADHQALLDSVYEKDRELFEACPDLYVLQAQIHTLKK